MIHRMRQSRASIPHVDLYGGEALPRGLDVVNFERIPARSSRFDWIIEPHVHDALVQVLMVVAGGGEVLIDDRRRVLEAPCLVVVPAGHVHAFRFDPQVDGPVVTAAPRPLESLLSSLQPDLLPALREPTVLPVDPQGRPSAALGPLFDAIEREARTGAPGQAAAARTADTARPQPHVPGAPVAFRSGHPAGGHAMRVAAQGEA